MTIEPFQAADIAFFLDLAESESWVAEQWEFEFLLSAFPRGCFCARGADGSPQGFVTALLHHRSGWIGNLIVPRLHRGRGIGKALFRKAAEALRLAGAQTIWLTASPAGEPLYEKHGFTRIDTVIRWVGTGRQRQVRRGEAEMSGGLTDMAYQLDAMGWGDRRTTLLNRTARRGPALQDESGFIVLQPCGEAVQFGPFAALDSMDAERLFESACKKSAFGTKILLDAPASNRAALRLFNRKNMRVAGCSSLMYAGRRPDYRPELLYGLATMGSCG